MDENGADQLLAGRMVTLSESFACLPTGNAKIVSCLLLISRDQERLAGGDGCRGEL